MYLLLQVATLTTVAIAMALPLAHLLEWPGKLRLSRPQYMAMQRVYYPGFTYAGLVEPLNVLLVLGLVLLTPVATPPFWLRAAAVILLGAMHATYWLVTHPTDRFWMAEARFSSAGAKFFGSGGTVPDSLASEGTWRHQRRRWEQSHALRAPSASPCCSCWRRQPFSDGGSLSAAETDRMSRAYGTSFETRCCAPLLRMRSWGLSPIPSSSS